MSGELVGVEGNSFASELMLNKMMNGQVAASNGNTVTAGLRSVASKLNLDAIEPSLISADLEVQTTHAQTIQTIASSAQEYLKDLRLTIAGGDATNTASAIANATTWLADLLATQVDGQAVFAAGKITPDLGLNSAAGAINIGNYDLAGKGATALGTALGATFSESGISSAIDTLMTGLDNVLSDTALTIRTLTNRSLALEDVASTYVGAANEQMLGGVGSSTGLLNNLVG